MIRVRNKFHKMLEVSNKFIAFRGDWARSHARASRWEEECQLVVEEMRRTLWFLKWKQMWWIEQTSKRVDVTPHVRDGLNAYAAKQRSVLHKLAQSFAKVWLPILVKYQIKIDWPKEYVENIKKMDADNSREMNEDEESERESDDLIVG